MNLYTQQHSTINGYGIWHYMIDSPIGNIHIVEWESVGHELKRVIIDENNEKAEKKYNSILKKMIDGKF